MPNLFVPMSIAEHFGFDAVGKTNNDNYIFHCPECENRGHTPDEHGKLYVKENYDGSVVYNCFRCGYSGIFKEGNNLGYKYRPKRDISELVNLTKSTLFTKTSRTSEYPYKIPATSAMMSNKAYSYLKYRGFSDNDIIQYDMRYAGYNDYKLRDRIIVPNVVITKNDGDQYTDMYVARSVDPTNPKRYLNPSGTNKSHIVFNLHRIPEGYPIIVSEGVFSAISVGHYSVATYGKIISNDQIQLILNNNPSSLFVALDSDAKKESLELCDRISRISSVPIYVVDYPDGLDANDILVQYNKEFINKLLSSATRYNSALIRANMVVNGDFTMR